VAPYVELRLGDVGSRRWRGVPEYRRGQGQRGTGGGWWCGEAAGGRWVGRSCQGKKTHGAARRGEEAVGGRDEEVVGEEGEAELTMKENDAGSCARPIARQVVR
jgi:hypothetical protein